MTAIDFKCIRATPKSQNDSFEALVTLLFQRSFPASKDSEFVSIRGDGGDGGVEAYFRDTNGTVHGVQAKYFFKLGASEFGQIKDSLKTALQNYPQLCSYRIYLPFDLTGKKSAGAKGKSETERFDTWKQEQEAAALSRGCSLSIELAGATKARTQLLALDPHGGMRRYWFDGAMLTESTLRTCLDAAKAFAGPRYTATLDVETSAHDALDFFGGTGDLRLWISSNLKRIAPSFKQLVSCIAEVTEVLPMTGQSVSSEYVNNILRGLQTLAEGDTSLGVAASIHAAAQSLRPLMATAESQHYKKFCEQHGADKDTQGFRQFNAEYMCSFPAANLDLARDAQKALADLIQVLESPAVQAPGAQSLLLVGPAGVGKTHAIVSAAERRLEVGAFSVVLFGDDFEGSSTWEVIRSKLGFSGSISRDELFECLQACSEAQGYPFVVFIDAINEGVMGSKWKDRLPEFLSQVKSYPGVKVCVSTRDTYKDLVVDSRFPGYAFIHPGFAGREFDALQHFAKAYDLHAEITPLFSEEAANPLFLHLACKTLKAQGRDALDLSLTGFVGLFEGYLELCNERVRTRLSLATPGNLVRQAMLSLAAPSMAASGILWLNACNAVETILQRETSPAKFLDELRKEGLIIVTPHNNGDYLVRFGYQRYGDVLRGIRLIDSFRGTIALDIPGLAAQLSCSDLGLLEVLASILPETEGIEVVDTLLGLPKESAHQLFLQGLPWRAKESITYHTESIVRDCLRLESTWSRVFETVLKLSLVPDHPLNAEWLFNILYTQDAATRDGFFWFALSNSYDDSGVVRSLVDATLLADLSRWPAESRRLATIVLALLSSSPDRRVHGRASKGLMRLLLADVGLAKSLVCMFDDYDDEYLLESLSGAVYCACLLSPLEKRVNFSDVLDALLTPGFDRPNAVIRDNIKFLAIAIGISRLPATTIAKLRCYPTPIPLPSFWPSEAQAKVLLAHGSVVRNMDFTSGPMQPDFWRKEVEPELRRFDLKKAKISENNLAHWVMYEIQQLGFPGKNEVCLAYDRQNIQRYGPGRGRPGYAERLGKKYSWIAFHRLIGMLSDNLSPAKDWNGVAPSKASLDHALRLRKEDLTDVRDIEPAPSYPRELVPVLRYQFPCNEDDWAWLERDDLPTHTESLVRKGSDGVEWFVLSFSTSDNQKSLTANYNTPYRRVSLSYKTILASTSFNACRDDPRLEYALQRECYSYRAYFAEYPREKAFLNYVKFGDVDIIEDGLMSSTVDLLRGNEWSYDYSWEEQAESLSVPTPALVEKLNLKWDRHSGWEDKNGGLAAFYLDVEQLSALLIRKDLLDSYLHKEGQVVYIRGFSYRGTLSDAGKSPSLEMTSLLTYCSDLGLLELNCKKKLFDPE